MSAAGVDDEQRAAEAAAQSPSTTETTAAATTPTTATPVAAITTTTSTPTAPVATTTATTPAVAEIAASSIRSGLAELELRSSQVLQRLENVKALPGSPNKVHLETTTEDEDAAATAATTTTTSAADGTLAAADVVLYTQLRQEHRVPSDILKSLEQLVAYSDSDDDPEFPLPALDDVSHLALISHSIVAYLSHLDRQHLLRVTNSIAGDATRWLGTLFHFPNAASSFHADNADAVLRTVRLAIVARCPGYLEGGIPALAQPCFYISENTTPVRLQYACRQLGIPLEAIKIIPEDSKCGTMDLVLLQKQVQHDLAASRTPLLVVADIGASLCGYVDNLQRLRDVCKAHNMWLHASGHGLAALVCAQTPGNVHDVLHSMALNLGSWLGVPSLPIVLLHRPLQNSALSAFESDPILSRRLNALSLWTSLQALGKKSIAERLHVAFQTCSILFEIASKCEGIRVLSHTPGAALSDIIGSGVFDVNALFDAAAPVVVYQFDGSTTIPITSGASSLENTTVDAGHKPLEKLNNASYFDRLNSWLGQILQRDCPNFDFEVIEHPTHGSCIRYCPLELGLGEQPPSSENLESFAQSLEAHVDILRATIKHKARFMHLVDRSEVLRLVPLPEWAGMGGVRFVPEGWESLLTDQAKTELNKLNIDLVEALKSTDNAFSLGEGTDGLICVRFGMVTHETEVEELLDLVVTVGKSVQENSRVLDTMSEIVKKGIEAATADLQRESEEKLWQEGILRHVPVVGRVFNWWSPPAKESGIKGRSLNLTQGVVESTENIYKYHMQMSGETAHQLPANRSPPTPMIQTPVVSSSTPPVFPTVEPVVGAGDAAEAAASTTATEVATAATAAVAAVAAAASAAAAGGATTTGAATTTTTTTSMTGNHVDHARTVSQSSGGSSSVPELVAMNSAINNNA
ncbi:LOW QUALITY PROTEIN: pyridoxal-dependent decarboxylase domain-containing protein 1 [Drosophila nasuta]|uniref:LOW QUALITY PROTEIN: pyridoxal-dependent decarboxylase domain-containing protein 1 n=1 Tax=Drosophila nasuta TaxID=42062 RepID=UPI00295ECC79|nr:LOW QUALITY PROTEIN: pyridoxal-dependent decarboxylase domain-containing protein 1 [Drosophila nasuta]